MYSGRYTESTIKDLIELKAHQALYFRAIDYHNMTLAFLRGKWPVFPVPEGFEDVMFTASTVDEQARVIVDILTTALNHQLIAAEYNVKNWKSYEQEKIKKHHHKYRSNKVEIPTLAQFITKTTGKIVRAIATAIQISKSSQDPETIKRITYLKFYLAGKSYLIDEISNTHNDFTCSAWKDVIYGANKFNPNSSFYVQVVEHTPPHPDIIQGSAYTTSYTTDDAGLCSGFCGALVNYPRQNKNDEPVVNRAVRFAAKHALRLISALPTNLTPTEYESLLKTCVSEVEKEANMKTKKKRLGISLLMFRTIKREKELLIIGVNIGNSLLLKVNPHHSPIQTVSPARDFSDNDPILFDNFMDKFDVKFFDERASTDAILVALAQDTHFPFEKSEPVKKNNGQRKYKQYTFSEATFQTLESQLSTEKNLNSERTAKHFAALRAELLAKQNSSAPALKEKKLHLITMQMPTALIGNKTKKNNLQLTPNHDSRTEEITQLVKDFLYVQFNLFNLSRSQQLCAQRIINAEFMNLSDYASYLEAERNALRFSELEYGPILSKALILLHTTFHEKMRTSKKMQNSLMDTESLSDKKKIYYNPTYNREFASRLLSCAYGLCQNQLREKVCSDAKRFRHQFATHSQAKVSWNIPQIAIAGTLAKKIIVCRSIADYEKWRDEAIHIYASLDTESKLAKVLEQILFEDLHKVVSIAQTEKPQDIVPPKATLEL